MPAAFPFLSLKISLFGNFCLHFPLAYVHGIETWRLKIFLYEKSFNFQLGFFGRADPNLPERFEAQHKSVNRELRKLSV